MEQHTANISEKNIAEWKQVKANKGVRILALVYLFKISKKKKTNYKP